MASRKRSSAPAAAPEGVNPKAAVPLRLRPPLQALPRLGLRAAGDPPLRGPAGRGRLGGAARARAGGHGELRTTDGRDVTLASVLPGGTPALVRANGEIVLGVQMQTSSDDVSRDVGTALAAALEAPAGAPVDPGPIGAAGSAGPAAAGAARPGRAVRGHRPRRLRVLAGGHRPRRGGAGRARARQRGDPADRAAARPGRRVLGAARATSAPTCAGCGPSRRRSCSTRWPGCRPRSRSCSARAPGTPAPSAPSASSSRCGTCRPTPRRRTGSSPATAFQTRLEQALAVDRAAHLRRAARPGRAALPPDHAALTASGRRGVSARPVTDAQTRMT